MESAPEGLKPLKHAKSWLVSPEFAETLGYICVTWNTIEDMMAATISFYLNGDHDVGNAIFAALSNQSRVDVLKAILSKKESNASVKECFEWLTTAYSTCAENRNILLHSSVNLKRTIDALVPTHLSKLSKTRPGQHVHFRYSVDELSERLDDFNNLARFSAHLAVVLVFNRDLRGDRPPLPLPGIPQLPKKMNPLRPEEYQDVLRQLESSLA